MESLSKAELRAHFKGLLKAQSSRREKLSLLESLLPKLPLQGLILSFASLPYEVSTVELNMYLLKRRQLALPRLNERRDIEAFRIENLADLSKSPLGIFEPNEMSCSKISVNDCSLILVPGLAFDRDGGRLGHGMGCYDRLLKKCSVPTIGIAQSCQIVDELPLEAHDQKVDHLVAADFF